MPLDGKVEQHTKPDIFSLEGLVEWLRGQDLDTGYDYWSRKGDCLLHAYLKDCVGKITPQADTTIHRVLGQVAVWRPHTYRAALARAEALLEHDK